MEFIYHYTSLETLFSILSNMNRKRAEKFEEGKSFYSGKIINKLILRATNINFLNDYSEGNLLPTALQKLKINPTHIQLAWEKIGVPHILSFSKASDSLTMWRGYAKDGNGVMLEFDKEKLLNSLSTNNYSRMFLENFDCEYTNIKSLVEEIKINYSLRSYHNTKYLNQTDITELKRLLQTSAKYKDEAFADEKEYRVVIGQMTVDEKYYLKNNLIIPYIEVPLLANCLTSIKLGPCVNYKKLIPILQQLLNNTHVDEFKTIVITTSNIPYINKQ